MRGFFRSGLILLAALTWSGGAADRPVVDPVPTTFPKFVQSAMNTIRSELTEQEESVLGRLQSDEFRKRHPELLNKISRRFVELTDDWLSKATAGLGLVPESLIRGAEEDAAAVERRLRRYFKSQDWKYRPMRVIFVPRRLMAEKGQRPKSLGRFILFYPDAFFATLDPHTPRKHTLIHESLHFNKTGPHLGLPLEEGITEVAAAQLALQWGMVSREELRKANYYPQERRAVGYILDQMVARSDRSRDQAREILLHAYLTGDQTEVRRILGAQSWARIVAASMKRDNLLKAARLALGD